MGIQNRYSAASIFAAFIFPVVLYASPPTAIKQTIKELSGNCCSHSGALHNYLSDVAQQPWQQLGDDTANDYGTHGSYAAFIVDSFFSDTPFSLPSYNSVTHDLTPSQMLAQQQLFEFALSHIEAGQYDDREVGEFSRWLGLIAEESFALSFHERFGMYFQQRHTRHHEFLLNALFDETEKETVKFLMPDIHLPEVAEESRS